ncbi:MAG: Mrp/NBP35 family ATP-binding protein [Thermoguttaceae bacterium]
MPPPVSEPAIRSALSSFQDPETGRSAVQLEQVHQVQLRDGKLAVTVGLTTWAAPLWNEIRDELGKLLANRFPGQAVEVHVEEHLRPAEPSGQLGLTAKSVIVVGAGKGGVGKSSIASYLACGLARSGAKVGLMDADVYGPSVPHLFGINETPRLVEGKIQPVETADVKILSMGLLIPPRDAVVWRGPMLHSALTQFVRDTAWGDLDYLVVDMPPGTGDVAISLSQLLDVTGAVVVCTPQDVALLDATRAITMFRKVQIEVLGMVENMSFFLCPACGTRHEIFGSGGAKRRAAEMEVPLLGEVPLDTQLRILGDEGRVFASFDHVPMREYLEAIPHALVSNLVRARRRRPVMPTLPLL